RRPPLHTHRAFGRIPICSGCPSCRIRCRRREREALSSLEAIFGSKQPKDEEQRRVESTPRAEQRVEQLLALNKAAVAITSELERDNLLQRSVEGARELIGCKYAARGVLGQDGSIARF